MSDTVLIVDDTVVVRKLLSKILQKAGYRLVEASNGNDAIEVALREKPDLILLDVVMPGKDGYTVCEELKSLDEVATIR